MKTTNQDFSKTVGLIGHPVKHSLSPRMHNAAFKALGMDGWAYQLFETQPEELAARIAWVREKGLPGVNVTVPYKIEVMQYLDEINPFAKEKVGAVNTIVNTGGKLTGYNTDADGFETSIEEDAGYSIEKQENTVVILGAGGASRAVVAGFLETRFQNVNEVLIFDRDVEKAKLLEDQLSPRYDKRVLPYSKSTIRSINDTEDLYACCQAATLIVNATGVGSSHGVGESPLPAAVLHKGQWVYDLGYNPKETELLRLAKLQDANTCNGLGMLVRQGAAAFELFTGKIPSVAVMRAAIEG
jgi:shikimate dehydrogenase